MHETAIDQVMETKRAEAIGQYDLFGGDSSDDASAVDAFELVIPVGEWDKSVLLGYEREMLGLYVSDHPLFGIEHVLAGSVDAGLASVMADEARPDGSILTIGGLITSVTRKITKKGDAWAIAIVEDLEGAIETMFFPATYQQCAVHLTEDAVVLVRGRLDKRDETPKLIAMEITIPDLSVGSARAGHPHPAGGSLHAAGGRAAQGGPGQPPRHHRGPPPAGQRSPHYGAAARRPAAGHRDAVADG